MTKETVLNIVDAWLIMAVVASLIMSVISVLSIRSKIYLNKTLITVGAVTVLSGIAMLACVIIHNNGVTQ